MKVRLKDRSGTLERYILHDFDRHGNERFYFRKKGRPKVRLRGEPGSDEFLEQYRAALKGKPLPQERKRRTAKPRAAAAKGSFRWLADRYLKEWAPFKDSDQTTQDRRRTVLDDLCAERVNDEDARKVGDMPFAAMKRRTIKNLVGRAATPATANARLKAFRGVFDFALDEDLIETSPAKEVSYRRSSSNGYHSWTVEEVAQYEARHAIGTTPRLALALLMFTGQRRSDVVVLGRPHRKDSGLQFTQFKGRKKSPVKLWIPILPELQRAIDARPSKGLTYLETKWGRPYTAKGFGVRFRKWCNQAGLPHCSAHGLRKAGAAIAAENGATTHQLMAIFGWKTIKEAERYTKAAAQRRMAEASMHLLAGTGGSLPR